jgi:uncharacterized protein
METAVADDDRRDEQVPRELLDGIVTYFEPVEVILFGSRARGGAGPDSDVDLLVVLDDDAPAAKLSLRALHEARRDYHRPVDLFACREGEFRARARVPGSLPHLIAREGAVVYRRGARG